MQWRVLLNLIATNFVFMNRHNPFTLSAFIHFPIFCKLVSGIRLSNFLHRLSTAPLLFHPVHVFLLFKVWITSETSSIVGLYSWFSAVIEVLPSTVKTDLCISRSSLKMVCLSIYRFILFKIIFLSCPQCCYF